MYSSSAHDDDLVPFVTYMIYAIRTKQPEFGQDLLNRMAQGEQFTLDHEIYGLCEALINMLDQLEIDLVLIIDDYHVIEHSLEIDRFMQHFLLYLPSRFHLVLSSRTRPSWEILRAMKLKTTCLRLVRLI